MALEHPTRCSHLHGVARHISSAPPGLKLESNPSAGSAAGLCLDWIDAGAQKLQRLRPQTSHFATFLPACNSETRFVLFASDGLHTVLSFIGSSCGPVKRTENPQRPCPFTLSIPTWPPPAPICCIKRWIEICLTPLQVLRARLNNSLPERSLTPSRDIWNRIFISLLCCNKLQ
jgi:hypothetical protein